MNNRIRLLLVLAGTLLTVVIAVGYIALNGAVSLDQARKQQDLDRDRERLLESLLLKAAGNLSREEVVSLVNRNFRDGHVIKEDKNQIAVDDVLLRFEGDKLVSVSSLNENSGAPGSHQR